MGVVQGWWSPTSVSRSLQVWRHNPGHFFYSWCPIPSSLSLVAPYRATLRYHCWDTPYRAIPCNGGYHSPKMVWDPPLWYLVSHKHISVIPRFATIIAWYLWNTHEKNKHGRVLRYRYWASTPLLLNGFNEIRRLRPPYSRRLKVRLGGSFALEKKGVSKGLRPNLLLSK